MYFAQQFKSRTIPKSLTPAVLSNSMPLGVNIQLTVFTFRVKDTKQQELYAESRVLSEIVYAGVLFGVEELPECAYSEF